MGKLTMKNVLMMLAVVAVAGCATGPQQPSQIELAIWGADINYEETLEAIEQFKTTDPVDCNSSSMLVADNRTSNIESDASDLYSVLVGGGRYSNVQKIASSEALDILNPLAIKGRFLMADSYLALGCLDQADETYRGIQTRYSGSSFASVRERALLGVTDVRSQR